MMVPKGKSDGYVGPSELVLKKVALQQELKHYLELLFTCLLFLIAVYKWRRIRRVGHVARMGEERRVYGFGGET
jgi:hypothetical protein